MEAAPIAAPAVVDDDVRLANLGYKPQLNRVLGFFSNFAVAFTYLSPMVGIYSLFLLGVGTGGPSYIWLTLIPLIGMLFVALVFDELASHYPVTAGLYQYSKFSVGLGFLFQSEGAQRVATNANGMNFHGHWLTGAALIAVLAPVYIFYGFESAGDIAEETKDASRQIPRAMRAALIWGGVASLFLTAALLLAMPSHNPVAATVKGGGVPFILGQLSEGMQDFLLGLIIFAFFSCGTSIQGAGSRLAFSFARDGALPKSRWVARVHPRFKTPVNALLVGATISALFV